MRSHQHNGGGTQNQGNTLGDRSCVRQSKLFRSYESGNQVKDILGVGHLQWKTNTKEGAYNGHAVYDHTADGYVHGKTSYSSASSPSSSPSKVAEAEAHRKAQRLHNELVASNGSDRGTRVGGAGAQRHPQPQPQSKPQREENIMSLARRSGAQPQGRSAAHAALPVYGEDEDEELARLHRELRRLEMAEARSRVGARASAAAAADDDDNDNDNDKVRDARGARGRYERELGGADDDYGHLRSTNRADLSYLREDTYIGPTRHAQPSLSHSHRSGAHARGYGGKEEEGKEDFDDGRRRDRGRGSYDSYDSQQQQPQRAVNFQPSSQHSSQPASQAYDRSGADDDARIYEQALRRQEAAQAELEALERARRLKAEIELLQRLSNNPQQLVRAQAPFALSSELDGPGEGGAGAGSPTRTQRLQQRKSEMLASMQASSHSLAPLSAKAASQTLAQRSTRPW